MRSRIQEVDLVATAAEEMTQTTRLIGAKCENSGGCCNGSERFSSTRAGLSNFQRVK
ncbi:hypothetical protein O9992_02590 [Vibrio lentus]|nr:hypothetical protein [Vibrio lentus]